MIIATFVATIFIPLFFVVTSRSRHKPGSPMEQAAEVSPAGEQER